MYKIMTFDPLTLRAIPGNSYKCWWKVNAPLLYTTQLIYAGQWWATMLHKKQTSSSKSTPMLRDQLNQTVQSRFA